MNFLCGGYGRMFVYCCLIILVCVHMYANICTHVCAGDHDGQNRVLDPLELKLQAIMICWTCMLGCEL